MIVHYMLKRFPEKTPALFLEKSMMHPWLSEGNIAYSDTGGLAYISITPSGFVCLLLLSLRR